MLPRSTLDRIASDLADIGAISLEDYLVGHSPTAQFQRPPRGPSPAPSTELAADGNAVTILHQTCQRVFRNTDPLKFEFIEQSASRHKQCVLTITKPDGTRRSYATQPVYAKKNEAKLEVAKIAVQMGALDFLLSVETSGTLASDANSMSLQSEQSVEDVEKCCLEWRAGHISPHWVPFTDPKLPQKQGCALRIQLSPHVARIYLADSTSDTQLDAQRACARAAVCQGVLDFIKYGNGQTHPSSPAPSAPSATQSPPASATTPWTLQAFYDSLPRPFPESFETNNVSEINVLGWMNNMAQNARGGKLILTFFFTSDGPPGLHGCLLKVDRPGEYKAFLVDARFPKRSDAKAAVCLQAMSEGIGEYIRSIASAVDSKITPKMRSFSSSLVYPAMTSALSKIDTDLHPHVEYDKERDAFGATLVVRLSMLPTTEQVRRYTVPTDYRSKADARVAVICHAAEQGIVEFVRFRGEAPPNGYVSPYALLTFHSEASQKRKKSGSVDDLEHGRATKRRKGKRRADATSRGEVNRPTLVGQHLSVYLSGDQIHGTSDPGDMGPSQSLPADGLCDASQPGVVGGGGSGVARPVAYSSYPAALDPRFVAGGGLASRGHGVQTNTYVGGLHPPSAVDALPLESGPSRAAVGASARTVRRPASDVELEPGEVLSSAESEFSVGSSRNEESEVPPKERGVDTQGKESVDAGNVAGKGKAKETSPAGTPTTVSRDGPRTKTTATSHVKNLIDYCAQHYCSTPLFHKTQTQGRFQVWIVIGKERFDLPTTYGSAEEGWQRVAKQVLTRLSKSSSGR